MRSQEDTLFAIVRRKVGALYCFDDVSSKVQSLKERYRSSDFAQVGALQTTC